MDLVFAKRIKKILGLIILTTVIGMSFLSVFPLITETQTLSTGETVDIYYDLASIEKSNNEQIHIIGQNLGLINICLWIILIFCILSLIGVVFFTSGKQIFLGHVLMLIGCAVIVFSIIALFSQWIFTKNISNMDAISLAPFFAIENMPIKYAQIPIIFSVLSFIGSVFYVLFVLLFSITHFVGSAKKRKPVKKEIQKQVEPKESPKTKKIEKHRAEKHEIPKALLSVDRPHEFGKEPSPTEPEIEENDSKYKPEPIANQSSIQRIKPFDEKEQPEIIDTGIKPVEDKKSTKPDLSTTISKKPAIQSEELPQISPTFEKALSSAIEKRHTDSPKKESHFEQPPKKKISVRCPECKFVFSVEKGKDITRIECPKCGKKGITK